VNALGALLVILNIVTILGPIGAVALVYQGNLQEVVIPPQVQEMIDSGASRVSLNGAALFNGEALQLPQFVGASVDSAARSVDIVLSFNNSLNVDLEMESISANVVCSEHGFDVGEANLAQPVTLGANRVSEMTTICHWTLEAENHFASAHSGESGVDLDATGITVEVNGITIQSNENYHIPNVPVGIQIAPPTYVNSQPDIASRTVRITFSFANPFSYALEINSVSADIVCSADGFLLGTAILAEPVTIPASSTSNFSILFGWTQEAENHFSSQHKDASALDVDVVGLTVNVNNITVKAPTSYHVPGVPLS
jgi:hypothetical protein